MGDADEEQLDLELRTTVGHLIRVSQQVHHSLWSSQIGELQLTSPQFAVLYVLAQEPSMDQSVVGARASLDRSTVAEIVSRLVDRRLVYRAPDPHDGRRRRITISDVGRELQRRAVGRALVINESLLAAINSEDRESLLRILSQIVGYHEHRTPMGHNSDSDPGSRAETSSPVSERVGSEAES